MGSYTYVECLKTQYIYIYIYTYTHMYIQIILIVARCFHKTVIVISVTCTSVHIHMDVYVYVSYICTYIHMYVCTYHTYIHICIHAGNFYTVGSLNSWQFPFTHNRCTDFNRLGLLRRSRSRRRLAIHSPRHERIY